MQFGKPTIPHATIFAVNIDARIKSTFETISLL